ncbi:hypothetical protein, partial [Pseudarthrobacter sp.]|uniref:hypothetical protein n=1 Tax=Pseudarthrobacter sp. TaxID=1934409 RepID=UPI002FC6568F
MTAMATLPTMAIAMPMATVLVVAVAVAVEVAARLPPVVVDHHRGRLLVIDAAGVDDLRLRVDHLRHDDRGRRHDDRGHRTVVAHAHVDARRGVHADRPVH